MSRRAATALLAVLMGGACSVDTATAPPDAAVPKSADRAGQGGTLSYPQANLVWEDAVDGTVAAAVLGDGRNASGGADAPANEYQGSLCGVWTIIYNEKKDGDGLLKFDPDTYFDTSGCGTRRVLRIDFGQGFGDVAPEFKVPGIWGIPTDGSIDTPAQLGMQGQGPACVLAFDPNYGVDAARADRLDGGSGPRQWRVHSQGSHTAACVTLSSRGKLVDTGRRYVLPFSVVVTEVP